MKYLSLPTTEKATSIAVSADCQKNAWAAHKTAWTAACSSYYRHKGNPWKIAPLELPIRDEQYKLYDKRKGGGPLARLRKTPGLLSCPMCGSSTTGHLDHYLPRAVYQEFSVLRANLVPACNHCNSGSKQTSVKGKHQGERFIHPYFDKWADKAIWYIVFIPPYAAVRFEPSARKNRLPKRERTINYHLKNVLGDQFHSSMGNKWATLPRDMKIRLKTGNPTKEDVEAQLKDELASSIATSGENSWDAAFFRGLLNNKAAIAFVLAKVLMQ